MRRGAPQRGGRGGFARQVRPTNTAALRSNIVGKQTNSVLRLMKDLRELRDADVPLVGVSAAPLDDSIFTWHANIRGPAGTAYEGGVFHMQINFPQNYPVSPPSITLFTDVTHPNVFGKTLCLDMLEGSGKRYEGWTSAYTVESILIQLQSFLFEVPAKKASNYHVASDEFQVNELLKVKQRGEHRDIYKVAVDAANAYKCTQCKHRGPIEPYPAFNPAETDESNFCILRDPKQMLLDELICYHTRAHMPDTSLGIGVSMSRLPRTGEIRNVQPTLDLLSLRAFTKHKVRTSIANEKFTHWLPLYFGELEKFEKKKQVFNEDTKKNETVVVAEIDPKQRMVHLLKKSITFLTQGSTRKDFSGDQVIQVMPKLIITHVVDMVNENKHISVAAIRRLVNFLRLFRLLIELAPEVDGTINEKVAEFISGPEKRVKDFAASLGDLLAYVTISNKFQLKDLLDHYLEEQLDRQAFWIIRAIPELDHTDPKYKKAQLIMEDSRNEVCFKTGLAGFHITMIFYTLCEALEIRYKKDMSKFESDLDSNHGCLPADIENELQKKFKAIQKVDNFKKYYKWMGQDCPDDEALSTRLRKAISNSKEKKYHGSSEHMNILPSMAEQATTLLNQHPSPFSTYDESSKTFTSANDPFWKKAVIEKFDWVSRKVNSNFESVLTAAEIASVADENAMSRFVGADKDKVLQQNAERTSGKWQLSKIQAETVSEDYDAETFTWRHLFHKLCFEQMIEYFTKYLDFKIMYEYINKLGSEISVLRIRALDKTKLKSNHYWIMTLLGKLPALKVLKLHKHEILHLGPDFFKFLQKGFTYMTDSSRNLTKIQINNLLGSSSQEYLYACLKLQPNLTILKFNDQNLSVQDAKAIGKVLADFRDIRELDISNCQLGLTSTKEIADGLMRAKKLEVLKAGNNPEMRGGANTIIYNLAFSPKIRHIDLSDSKNSNADTAEALYKLLKISGAIETLILNNSNVQNFLKEEFYQALGENQTLEYLNLDHTSYVSSYGTLAKAIAMNARKNGSLKAVSIQNWMTSNAMLNQFVGIMEISDYDHEMWYGDKKLASKMEKDQLVKKMHFGLEYLDLQSCKLTNFGFHPKVILKQKTPVWPNFLKFVTQHDIDFNFRRCGLVQKDMEIFQYALGENPIAPSKIRSLNLSKNNITKEGAKFLAPGLALNASLINLDLSACNLGVSGVMHIAEALETNKTLQRLNLYRNILDVDGARALSKALKVNKTLTSLDVGHNRIRKTGLHSIVDGIVANPESKLVNLGIRSNFINDDGFSYLFEQLVLPSASHKHKLTHIFVRYNFLTEYHKLSLFKQIKAEGVKVFIDDFENADLLKKENIDRSIWVSPLPEGILNNQDRVIKFFEQQHECGLVTDIRLRSGRKVTGRTKTNIYAVVEFAHENSVPRSLKLASKKLVNFMSCQGRVYKTGTKTAVIIPSQRRRQTK